jgi:hypothetical protein
LFVERALLLPEQCMASGQVGGEIGGRVHRSRGVSGCEYPVSSRMTKPLEFVPQKRKLLEVFFEFPTDHIQPAR